MAQEGAAFYRFGRFVELGPVTEGHWEPYINTRFRRGAVDITPGVVRAIVTATEGVPYYVMRLCRALWSPGVHGGRLGEADVRDAFSDLVAEGDQLFAEAWDALTLAQRRALVAVAEGQGGAVFAERIRNAYELGPSSTVARSLARLQELSFIARERGGQRGAVRYRIVDPLLRAWVLRGRPPIGSGERPAEHGQEPPLPSRARAAPRRTRGRRN